MLVITSKAIAAIQAEIDKLNVEHERAFLLAGNWSDEPRISALTPDEVRAEFKALDQDPYDDGWKSEDYDTVDELANTIGGLQRAIEIIRELEREAAA